MFGYRYTGGLLRWYFYWSYGYGIGSEAAQPCAITSFVDRGTAEWYYRSPIRTYHTFHINHRHRAYLIAQALYMCVSVCVCGVLLVTECVRAKCWLVTTRVRSMYCLVTGCVCVFAVSRADVLDSFGVFGKIEHFKFIKVRVRMYSLVCGCACACVHDIVWLYQCI